MEKKLMIIIAVVVVLLLATGGIVYMLMNQHQAKDIKTVDDLNGAYIAVQTGTTGDDYAKENYEDSGKATVCRYTTYNDAVTDLKNKKVDAIIMDKTPAETFVAKNSGLRILELDSEKEYYGFAFKKDNTALRDSFNTALATIKANGTYDEILEYWSAHSDGNAAPKISSTGTGSTTIKVATSPDFPPYDALYDNAYTGIDMDVVRAICNELNYKVEFVNVDFDGIVTGVSTGVYDVGASGLTINEERQKEVLFSDAYAESVQVAVVRIVEESQ